MGRDAQSAVSKLMILNHASKFYNSATSSTQKALGLSYKKSGKQADTPLNNAQNTFLVSLITPLENREKI
jgi:hypothetical protein